MAAVLTMSGFFIASITGIFHLMPSKAHSIADRSSFKQQLIDVQKVRMQSSPFSANPAPFDHAVNVEKLSLKLRHDNH